MTPTIETRLLILVSAVLELGTGLALLFVPGFVVRILLGTALVGPGVATSRLCGIALISLGLASWPKWEPTEPIRHRPDRRAARALLVYNASATAYLALLMVVAGYRGFLLVPAIVIHAVLAMLLARAVVSARALRESAQTARG